MSGRSPVNRFPECGFPPVEVGDVGVVRVARKYYSTGTWINSSSEPLSQSASFANIEAGR
jgi:hypothetical protein